MPGTKKRSTYSWSVPVKFDTSAFSITFCREGQKPGLCRPSDFVKTGRTTKGAGLSRLQNGAYAGADGAADIERRGGVRIPHLHFGRLSAEQLERAPADHGDSRGADGVSLGDEPAGGVDGALTIGRRLAIHPVSGTFARLGFADHFGAQRAHHGEAIVYFGHVHVFGFDVRHLVGGAHGTVRARRMQYIAAGLADGVGGLSPSRHLHALRLRNAELR